MMGWKLPWLRRASVPAPMLDDDAIRQALEHRLLQYACLFQQNEGIGSLQTVKASTPNLYVKINGRQVAYVHEWRWSGDGKTMTVGHLAVATEFVGKGFGLALALGLARAFWDELHAETIVFSERVYSPAHERLFQRLGAVPRAHRDYPGKPDWVWSIPSAAAA